MENIIRHFDKYLPLGDNEKEALTSRLIERKLKRKQYLLDIPHKQTPLLRSKLTPHF